jgi:hypothetical protein
VKVAVTFRALQRALTEALVLQLPVFDKTFIVECDAVGMSFGVILHQGSRPDRVLQPTDRATPLQVSSI